MNLSELLKGRPSVKIRIRAVDSEGNFSDDVNVELVSKERKYDLQIQSNMFGDQEATFKCPKDRMGLVAVLKSVIRYGVRTNLLSASEAQELEALLSDLSKGG